MKIEVNGTIIPSDYQEMYDWFGLSAFSPLKLDNELKKLKDSKEEIIIEINSGGGDVWSASSIYTKLMELKNPITTKVMGLAASAATVIAQAGDKRLASPLSSYMIHNISMQTYGDNIVHQKNANTLSDMNTSLATLYSRHTNKSIDELLNLMKEETWFNPKQMKENNFIDEIMFDNQKVTLSNSASGEIPQHLIDKYMNEIKPNLIAKEQEEKVFFMQKNKAQAKLNLIKIKEIK